MTPCGGPAGVEADKIRTELGINYHMVRKESADPKLAVSCGPHCRNTIMKLTKNAAALLLAASLAVSVCATPVFAGGGATGTPSNPGTLNAGPSETQVKYVVTEAYEWTVPALIDFGKDAGPDATRVVNTSTDKNTASKPSTGTDGTAPKVIVTKNVIKSGNSLKITLAPASPSTTFTVKNEQNVELSYKVTLTKTKIGKTDATPNKEIDTTENQILEIKAGTDEAEAELKFELSTEKNVDSEKAGTYTGTVQFTADATQPAST